MEYIDWIPGMEIPKVKDLVGMDTETELIVDHNYPDVVCLQVWSPELSHFVWWEDIDQYLDIFQEVNPHAHYVFHNAPFDLGVMNNHKTLFNALEQDRLHDTYVIDSMCCAKFDGYIKKDRKLDQIAKRRLGIVVDKDESIRLTFKRSMGRDGVSEAHKQYAMKDPKVTYDLAKIMSWNTYPTEPRKVRMMVALEDISKRGFLTDTATRIALTEKFQKEVDETTEALADWGWYPKEKGNEAVIQHILKGVEADMGIKFERTPTGKIKTTDDALEPIEGDEFVDSFKKRAHASKMISTYLGEGKIDADGRARTRFNLAVTMRTTSSNPNIQNVPRKGGIRGMFVPPPGFLLSAVDYSQLELCALAESCYRRFGFSKLMDTINAGIDCHKYMATFYTGKAIEHIDKSERQLAKVCNFG